MSTAKLITGMVAGAATGALLGILFAPDKGTTTRRRIDKRGTDMADAIKNGFRRFGEAFTNKYQDMDEETIASAQDEVRGNIF